MGEADVAAEAGPLLLEAEAAYGRTDGGTGMLGLPVPKAMLGGSAQITWRFFPAVLAAKFPSPLQASSFGVTARYSMVDTDTKDPDPVASTTDANAYTRRDRLGFGLSFRPIENYVARVEYEFRTEAQGNAVDDDRAVVTVTAAF